MCHGQPLHTIAHQWPPSAGLRASIRIRPLQFPLYQMYSTRLKLFFFTLYLVWPPFASLGTTHLFCIDLIRLLIVACWMFVHSSSMTAEKLLDIGAVIYANSEHLRRAQFVTCPMRMLAMQEPECFQLPGTVYRSLQHGAVHHDNHQNGLLDPQHWSVNRPRTQSHTHCLSSSLYSEKTGFIDEENASPKCQMPSNVSTCPFQLLITKLQWGGNWNEDDEHADKLPLRKFLTACAEDLGWFKPISVEAVWVGGLR